jgi:Glycosyl hydrolase family 12
MICTTITPRSSRALRSSLALIGSALALACASSAGTDAEPKTPAASSVGDAPPAAGGPAPGPEQAAAPGKGQPGVVADCQAWATRSDGRYRYENNVWGADKVKGKFQQCLLTREQDGRTLVGWTWSFPGFDPSVFAYPEVIVGWKPWSGGASTDARFPMRVSEVGELSLDYEVETSATGSYNLAPEIWLTDSPASQQANAKSIVTEVMFWMDYAEGARPAGKIIETVTLNGVPYELWREESIGKSANGKGWQLLSYKSPTRQLKGSIDIAALLRHLVKAKLVSASEYVASVEFGNEVMGGTGTTWIKHFDVRVGG